tara:strand:+ start:361 stop:792 length:432 start_codon:yes stop_codon:yes gene_type:complete
LSIFIYTDGACSGNPGIGGWGAVILMEGKDDIHLHGGSENTTNNQMELTAAIKALRYFEDPKKMIIYTDSQYLKNGIELWINNWKKNGWKTTSKKEVKNKILWEELDKEISKHNVEWKWIKGHSGNQQNEIADSLARKYILKN